MKSPPICHEADERLFHWSRRNSTVINPMMMRSKEVSMSHRYDMMIDMSDLLSGFFPFFKVSVGFHSLLSGIRDSESSFVGSSDSSSSVLDTVWYMLFCAVVADIRYYNCSDSFVWLEIRRVQRATTNK